MTVRPGPGRPKKFGRPSRAVTVTLPEDVLARLRSIHTDLGHAIVTVAERHGPKRPRPVRDAELASYGKHAIILVAPVGVLKRLPGVKLIPIGGGRALISLDVPNSIPKLELDIRDAAARHDVRTREGQTLQELADILQCARLSRGTRVRERTIIVLESTRQPRLP